MAEVSEIIGNRMADLGLYTRLPLLVRSFLFRQDVARGFLNDEAWGRPVRCGNLRPRADDSFNRGIGANVPELSLRRRHPLHRRGLPLRSPCASADRRRARHIAQALELVR